MWGKNGPWWYNNFKYRSRKICEHNKQIIQNKIEADLTPTCTGRGNGRVNICRLKICPNLSGSRRETDAVQNDVILVCSELHADWLADQRARVQSLIRIVVSVAHRVVQEGRQYIAMWAEQLCHKPSRRKGCQVCFMCIHNTNTPFWHWNVVGTCATTVAEYRCILVDL